VSALRGLDENVLSDRLTLLGATDGQQYDRNPVLAGRFWGNGEFVAENEAYGVVVTFAASGDDLPHPDEEAEKERMRTLRGASAIKKAGGDEEDSAPAAPKVTVEVADAQGEVIRTFTAEVHQGINRVVWPLERDGLPPLPGSDTRADADLPGGIEVVPGDYRLTVTLDDVSQSIDARVLADPRVEVSPADRLANQAMQLELQDLSAMIDAALARIITARRDLQTIETLIEQSEEPDAYEALQENVAQGLKQLSELESVFRVPKDTKGRPYTEGKLVNVLRRARSFLTSTYEAPSPTARAFAELAEQRISDAVADLNDYLGGDFAETRSAFAESGLQLLGQRPL
jgi:hypothetical protein